MSLYPKAMRHDIAPCPFCGEIPHLFSDGDTACQNKDCGIHGLAMYPEEWNRRHNALAAPTAPSAPVAPDVQERAKAAAVEIEKIYNDYDTWNPEAPARQGRINAVAGIISRVAQGWQPPKGWKLVPLEPTKEMLKRGFSPFMAAHDPLFIKNEPCGPIYKCMIDAAPAAPGESATQEDK